MVKLEFRGKQIIGYICDSCNSYNDILSLSCHYCKTHIWDESLILLSYRTKLLRTGEFIDMSNDQLELHIKYFHHEKTMIKDMDAVLMYERRDTLRLVAYEAKARLTAHDDEERERNAQRTKEQKAWLLSSSVNDPNVTDAIAAVKERTKRVSKSDKLLASLKSLGIANADSMVAAAIKNQTGAAINTTVNRKLVDKRESPLSESCRSNSHHKCSGFRDLIDGDETKLAEGKTCDCKCHKPKVKFDPASLSVLKKN